mgnify:CR=1 FL=1
MYYLARSKLKDLEMERGIFVGTVPNTVLQKLLHRSIIALLTKILVTQMLVEEREKTLDHIHSS